MCAVCGVLYAPADMRNRERFRNRKKRKRPTNTIYDRFFLRMATIVLPLLSTLYYYRYHNARTVVVSIRFIFTVLVAVKSDAHSHHSSTVVRYTFSSYSSFFE